MVDMYVMYCANLLFFACLQSGAIILLRPDLIDYETNTQFDLVVVAHDLVLPVNQRRQVSKVDSRTTLNLNVDFFLFIHRVRLTLF